ncbi:MAG: ATP-dependent DNA helicase RecG, partial [Chloroflexi bacterium]|nr:ATP-dependent DNA helicase RecG [Chloroflexota bacterium]
EGISPRTIRRIVKTALDRAADRMPDPLPTALRRSLGLLPLAEALRTYHYPDSAQAQEDARRRLAFEELLLIQLGVLSQRRNRQQEHARPLAIDRACLAGFLAALPFALTGVQQRALEEIVHDLQRPRPMSRLLQGDVGSGKTVVAAAALVLALCDGMQGAIMAPTEILAEQHARNLGALLERGGGLAWDGGYLPPYLHTLGRSVQVALLVGSLSAREKEEVRSRIAAGQVDLVVGTHALIQEEVAFSRLGLVVIDEQHRFGVAQRWTLRQKGDSPHVLVMTATPIPRTLALTLYGDLDVSVLDELPPGRQPIITRWLRPTQRREAYRFVREQVRAGRQAFVICPLVEESEVIEARAATAEYERLSREVFPDLRLGLLHGRMSAQEKDRCMRQFREVETHILVSTSVVEVGIDVPNATVMLVEGADRFGLAQLHQFRGRVGRGAHQSHCLLLADDPSPEAQERLAILERTQDGFVLAEEDLRLRGPGEFFGTRQTGLPAFRLARLSDFDLMELARQEAETLLAQDPHLAAPEHQELARARARIWTPGAGDVS